MSLEEIVSLGEEAPKTGLGDMDLDDTNEMQKLTAEMDKLNDVNMSSPVNWKLVEQCSRIILRDYVKHFQVAAYYGISLIRTGMSLSDVTMGAGVFLGIFKNHWEDALPAKKRKKGRFNAVEYWLENVGKFFDEYNPEPLEPEVIEDCTGIIKELDAVMAGIDEDLAPNLRRILTAVGRLPVKASQEEKAEEPAVVAENENKSTSGGSSEMAAQPSSAPSSVASAPKAPLSVPHAEGSEEKCKVAFNFLLEASDEIFAADIYDPLSYMYRRMATWGKIKKMVYSENGVTRLPAPPDEIFESLEKLVLNNEYPGLIRTCEGRVSKYIYWLDLSYYSAFALKKLGKDDAAKMVEIQVQQFVKRFDGLADLHFENGKPMCSTDTKNWINSLLGGSGGGSGAKDTVKTRMTECLNLSRNEFAKAVKNIEDYIRGSEGLDRLRYQAALARIMSLNNRSDLAVGLIEIVLKTVREHNLKIWNRTVSAELLSISFDIYVANQQLDRASEVLIELVSIDPELAITKKYTD